jgi:hypothetical protein
VTAIPAGSAKPTIQAATSAVTMANRWDHFLARSGIWRRGHAVEPGLYALGKPKPESPVLVSANYTLSFDALRSALAGIDCYIMVLDTKGINVWCAAGKGTFGTDEVVSRIEATNLQDAVSHRVIILPQLGAPGVSAHEVKHRSGFKVEYGPVRAADLPEYLETRRATPEMRRVSFDLGERLVLIPVEFAHVVLPAAAVAVVVFFVGWNWAAVIAAVLAGTVLFPVVLPWIPTRDFSSKGFVLGGLVALPFALQAGLSSGEAALWEEVGGAFSYMLVFPPVTAFLTLNFTGSTTFTSRTGVRREIFRYVPAMAWMFGVGIVLSIVLAVI